MYTPVFVFFSEAGRRPAHEALLRIHCVRLARGDAEKRGVERFDVAHEAAFARVAFADGLGIGIVQIEARPARGERTDGIATFDQRAPIGLGGLDAAGKAAGHRNDGDGLEATGLEFGGALLKETDGRQGEVHLVVGGRCHALSPRSAFSSALRSSTVRSRRTGAGASLGLPSSFGVCRFTSSTSRSSRPL